MRTLKEMVVNNQKVRFKSLVALNQSRSRTSLRNGRHAGIERREPNHNIRGIRRGSRRLLRSLHLNFHLRGDRHLLRRKGCRDSAAEGAQPTSHSKQPCMAQSRH